MKKRIICVVILLLLFANLLSCNNDEPDIDSDTGDAYYADTSLEKEISDAVETLAYEPDPQEYETMYDNMIISLEKEAYSVDFDNIKINITNGNGNPFVIKNAAYMEKYIAEDATWEKLTYIYSPGKPWIEAPNRQIFDSYYSINVSPDNIKEKLTPGTYRFIINIGEKDFYSPEFELE